MSIILPILMYHQVTPNLNTEFKNYSITPEMFNRQMSILKRLGYTPINLTQYEYYRGGRNQLPKKPIIITFDDCYQECIDYAVPILRENGFTSIFYVPTDYVGEKSRWIMQELGVEFPIIDWETIKQLDLEGFQIGSHSLSHPHLAEIPPKDCFDELRKSRQILEEKLGHEIVHLAYPYGSFNDTVKELASKAGYHTACGSGERFLRLEDDAMQLPRIEIVGESSIIDFILKLHFEGRYNTTREWRRFTRRKMQGVGRLLRKIRDVVTRTI